MTKVYLVWIWWIWLSWLARYYNSLWYQVYWSDKIYSDIIESLKREWMDIIIWEDYNRINQDFGFLVYSEAIPRNQSELKKSIKLSIPIFSYSEALWKIVYNKKLISVSWTHGKSTVSSMISLMMRNSSVWVNCIIWTLLKEFGNKNIYVSSSDYFVLEACEYKRAFLNYKSFIWIITNLDLDHLDYYKNLDDYINAFKFFVLNIKDSWFVLINWDDSNSKKLIWINKNINEVIFYKDYFLFDSKKINYPKLDMQIPWEHILLDAKISYIIGYLLALKQKNIISSLNSYNWTWRRMELIGKTKNYNLIMSDYWHHPLEISLTLNAIKSKYKDKRLFVVFQPHQYSRTIGLLEWFKNCFWAADTLVITNIYECRDSIKDKKSINPQKFVDEINKNKINVINWKNFDNTVNLIKNYDKNNPGSSIILLLGAWDIDDLQWRI